MNKEQLQKNIRAMKARLTYMEEQLKECDKLKMFPQRGETYWHTFMNGRVEEYTALDNSIRLNVYRTEEEANNAVNIAVAKQRVKYAIECANDGWTPDWITSDKNYCFEQYTNKELFVTYYCNIKSMPNWMYMKSEKIAEQILAEYREDLELIFSE